VQRAHRYRRRVRVQVSQASWPGQSVVYRGSSSEKSSVESSVGACVGGEDVVVVVVGVDAMGAMREVMGEAMG